MSVCPKASFCSTTDSFANDGPLRSHDSILPTTILARTSITCKKSTRKHCRLLYTHHGQLFTCLKSTERQRILCRFQGKYRKLLTLFQRAYTHTSIHKAITKRFSLSTTAKQMKLVFLNTVFL